MAAGLENKEPLCTKKRQANYELLRIIAMLMVISLHYLNHGGLLLTPGEDITAVKITGSLIEAFCIVAVNVYVLISGYFLVEAGFRIRRMVNLVCQVLFYAMLIPLTMLGTGMFSGENAGGIYKILSYLFPLQTEHYWFATSYVLLYLFTPLLNAAVKSMNRRQLQITIAGLLVMFSLIRSIVPFPFVTDSMGYDFGWFLCVYLVAAYIRLYGLKLFDRAKRAWGIYIGCALMIFAIVTGACLVHARTGKLVYLMELPYHYNFVLCLLGAVALFYGFGYVRIPEGRVAEVIGRLSPFTFGVYLFHEHIDIRNEWTGWLEEFMGPVPSSGIISLLVHLLIAVIVVYLAGTFIDAIRFHIFCFFERYLAETKLAGWIKGLDGEFR